MITNSLTPRASTVAAIGSFQIIGQEVVFYFKSLEKTSRPNNIRGEVRCPGGTRGSPLSLIDSLLEYQSCTGPKRDYCAKAEGTPPNRLFISNTKPYQAVTPSTLAKWLLRALDRAGIDTALYKAHST